MTNSLPNDNNLNSIKLKAFADEKINSAHMMSSVSDRIENVVRKGENAGYQHFLLFPQSFLLGVFLRIVKSRECVTKS